jgi:hypothetical protein
MKGETRADGIEVELSADQEGEKSGQGEGYLVQHKGFHGC